MNVKAAFAALMTALLFGGSFGGSLSAMPAAQAKMAAAGRTIEITGDDTMKFNVTTITAKPGEQLTVKITNKGTMPKMAAAHNFVLLKKGVDLNAFTTAAVMAGAPADYIPAKFKDQVIASTKLTGPGESADVSFKAPTAPGDYVYICSFPGHFATMKGTLTVK
jgi:azurin